MNRLHTLVEWASEGMTRYSPCSVDRITNRLIRTNPHKRLQYPQNHTY